ncbi:MAG: YgjV family protein [Oscillospiraceae bacterium]|nr:YgjV family protein [Oscillospiraceae bacterium]
MSYYIGQAFGLMSTACCLIMPVLKHKKQMLWTNAANNSFAVLNVLLISGWGSAITVCAVAVLQSIVALGHLKRDTKVSRKENVLFVFLFLGCGLLGYRRPIDVLPIVGAMFNMLSTFQRDEQRTRWLLLVNASIFTVYYAIIGSTATLSCICAIVSTVAGLLRYRKKGDPDASA